MIECELYRQSLQFRENSKRMLCWKHYAEQEYMHSIWLYMS